jgi:hypothetical protein
MDTAMLADYGEDYVDDWYEEYDRSLSDRLQYAMAVVSPIAGAKRGQLVDTLGRQMGFDPQRFRWASYVALAEILTGLDAWLAGPRGDSYIDRTEQRGERLTDSALKHLELVDDLLALAAQLQLAPKQKIQITLRDASSRIQAVIHHDLSERIYQLLRVWREAGAWEAERPKTPVFRKSSRDVPASVLELARSRGSAGRANRAS